MAAGEQLGKTGVDINNSIKECKFTQPEMTASSCSADIESAGADLATATVNILSAISVCEGGDAAKCTSAVSQVVKEFGVASKDIE